MNPQPVTALPQQIEAIMAAAIRRACPQDDRPDPVVRRSQHADFQSNGALPLAKRTGRSPRDLAVDIVAALGDTTLIDAAEVSGPGFVNLTLTDAAVWRQVDARLTEPRLGVPVSDTTTTVVDYSAPNVAKRLHVGHLRSTVIGDTLARLLEFLGATVIRQNHLGDWGTQFGMLIQYLREHPDAVRHLSTFDNATDATVLDTLYPAARAEFDGDPEFAERARRAVVDLQSGDRDAMALWRRLVRLSIKDFTAVYGRLGIGLTESDIAGESFYNDRLAAVVTELVDAGIAVESQGALCVFNEGFVGPDGSPTPLIVRKTDGGFGYAATDLATIRYRLTELGARRVLYVVDARQSLHFAMVIDTARRAGWLRDGAEAVHVAFGTVLDADGRPFKTRSGGTVPLTSLLDAAVDGARPVVAEKNPDMPPAELDGIAEAAGIGAVKYAELSTGRTTDYRFDVAQMVSLTGDTSVYLQYAHTRIVSLLNAAGPAADLAIDPRLGLAEAERALALHLDGYAGTLVETAARYEPHRLTTYLYQLAKQFSVFYEQCPVLAADSPARTGNRLALANLTRRTLAHGLGLLGIATPQRM